MHKNVLLLVVSISLLFLSAQDLFARGGQEDPIRQARELVAENRINDAILLLEQTVRDDPERIQQAEALLRTIREIRGEYNVLFDQLIDNLVNNPDDIVRTLEIIDRMESLDEFPNERVVEQIQDARVVAQLAYDRSVLNQRMDEALVLLERGEYIAAVDIYVSLRELQRDRFEDRGYGDIFVNSVNEAVATVPVVADSFREQLPDYQRTGASVQATIGNTAAGIDEQMLVAFFAEAADIAGIIDEATTLAGEIAVLKSQVPLQFPDDPVDWYLNFQDSITRGRSGTRGEEGIVFAITAAYRDSMAPLVAAGSDPTRNLIASANAAAEEDRFGDAVDSYGGAVQSALLWQRAAAAEAGIFVDNLEIGAIVEQRAPDGGAPIITAEGFGITAASLLQLAGVMDLFVETGVERADTLFSLESRKDSANGIVSTLRSGTEAWEESRTPFDAAPEGYVTEEVRLLLEDATERWNGSIARAVSRERELVRQIAALRTENVPAAIDTVQESLDEAAPLVEGVTEPTVGGDGGTRFVRYPDEALGIYQEVIASITENLDLIGVVRDDIVTEPEYVLAGEPVQAAQERLDGLEQQLNGVLVRARAGSADAQSLIAQAEGLINQAEARTADMRAAIAALQVDAARNNFEAVREAYFESLELRENAPLRQEVDAVIQQLGAELQELENVIVVRRVRELLTAASDLYNRDEYVSARDTLLEAQQTWEQTNVVDNTEIQRLLRLVTAALSLEEGRELAITDPLYPILSNYLSIARDDFNRGAELYNEGREVQANPLFDRAIENLRNVRDVRPLNWDARILELRIAQIRNAEDFDTVFAARYNQALGRLDDEGPLQVYSELEVLAEINPDYPGIQDQIRRLEIALNLRPDPVDQARQRQANDLYRRAQALGTGSRDQITVAVSLLEQAITLDPTNGQAAFLLDQLRIQLGGQATVALTTGDEQQYRRAETLFSQGQVLQALQIVERLLQDADNQNYPPLVDLRRRIGLRLGI